MQWLYYLYRSHLYNFCKEKTNKEANVEYYLYHNKKGCEDCEGCVSQKDVNMSMSILYYQSDVRRSMWGL